MNYTTKEATKIIGLSLRQLDYWDRTHFIKPTVSDASGRGSVRLYSFSDLVQLRVARGLINQGVTLQKVRRALNYLRRHMPNVEQPLSELQFLTDGETIFVLTRDNRVIIDTLRSGQVVFSIALGEMVEGLKGEVVALRQDKQYELQVRGSRYSVFLSRLGNGACRASCPALLHTPVTGNTVEETLGEVREDIERALDRKGGRGETRPEVKPAGPD
jgi:DNA-binding transcriptional MerR regulator